uniref:Uncharacterized protein n=1 Tax=Ditylenchus dipsaci TaxID=166011 RepID=A0A915ER34_9BILA
MARRRLLDTLERPDVAALRLKEVFSYDTEQSLKFFSTLLLTNSSFDYEQGHSPHRASDVLANQLNLNASEKQAVFRVLDQTDEDPILVVRLNQNWVNVHGEAAANQVLDAIAIYNMPRGQRRDDQAMCLCFHFAESSQISACRLAVLNNHRNAFAPSPEFQAHMAATNQNYAGNLEPMAFAAQVNKIAVRCDDIQPCPFFYW